MDDLHYQVVVACHDKLVNGIKQGADSLADAMLLPESLRDDINTERDQIKKARQLVGLIKDKIKLNPSRFNDFMSILREKSDLYPQFGTLAMRLEDKKAELLQEGEDTDLKDKVIGVFTSSFIPYYSSSTKWVKPITH